MSTSPDTAARVRLAITNDWGGTLHPALQHTLGGDLVLSNQFDPLVGTDENGVVVPLAAESWTISPDQRVFTFRINTKLRFSDGTSLSAEDFKTSWEQSLKLDPKSANQSLLDLLYKLEGFSQFKEAGGISGIQIESPSVLKLTFETPFRMALDHLTGIRFAAFRDSGGKVIGTGRYTIHDNTDHTLRLDPNPYHEHAPAHGVDLIYVSGDQLEQALLTKKVDGLAFIFGDEVPLKLLSEPELEFIYGQESLHIVLEVNGTSSGLMKKRENRQALQYVLHVAYKSGSAPWAENEFTRADFQLFMPLQAGRLDETQVTSIIEAAKSYLPQLQKDCHTTPLRLVGGPGTGVIRGILKRSGIRVSEDSRELPWDQLADFYYKRSDYDVLYGAFSVVNGDPDGIYHALGRNGAILNPVILRNKVADLLEVGRRIIRPEELNAHYRHVAQAVLEEVPIVHLGYSKSMAVLRRSRLSGATARMRRNQGQVHVFTPKRGSGA